MYAIIEDGGKQYRVSQGDIIDIEIRVVPDGKDTIELDKVLLIKDDKHTVVGAPIVAGAKVLARIDGSVKGKKLRMLKYRRRKNSSTRHGHRQKYLRVAITDIRANA